MYISQIADMSRALLDQCVLGKCVYVYSVLWMSSKDTDVLKDGGRGTPFHVVINKYRYAFNSK